MNKNRISPVVGKKSRPNLVWLWITIPFAISLAGLLIELRPLNASLDASESRGYEVLLTSGLLMVVLIPLTIILLAVCMRKVTVPLWLYITGLIAPSLPNAVFQITSSSVLPLLVSWIPGVHALWFGTRPTTEMIASNATVYLGMYIVVGVATYRAARNDVRSAAFASAAVTAALVSMIALGSH